MATNFDNTLVIAISSRALFDMTESHQVYTENGIDAYCQYQIDHETEILLPGVAFSMVKKFLALNEPSSNNPNQSKDDQHVEIVLISRNSADTGLRVFNSIEHYGLDITRAAFTGGQSPYQYVQPFGAGLFLSADPVDVSQALDAGHAAATILPSQTDNSDENELKIAFDGDAVLFSDQAEQVYQQHGLDAFSDSERLAANDPLPGGPFKNILGALAQNSAKARTLAHAYSTNNSKKCTCP